MNGYYDLDLHMANAIYEDRIRSRREPITLGRPEKARGRKGVGTGNARSLSAIPGALRSVARAVASLLM